MMALLLRALLLRASHVNACDAPPGAIHYPHASEVQRAFDNMLHDDEFKCVLGQLRVACGRAFDNLKYRDLFYRPTS